MRPSSQVAKNKPLVANKQFKASVLWINDSRIHRNVKIARGDSAVTHLSS